MSTSLRSRLLRASSAGLIVIAILGSAVAQTIPPYAYRIPLTGVDAKPSEGGSEDPGNDGPEMPFAIGNNSGTYEGMVGARIQIPAPQVSGGKPPYRYALDATLPAGFDFSNGAISGTPQAHGLIERVLTISDSGINSASVSITIDVKEAEAPAAPLVIGDYGAIYRASVGEPLTIPAPSVSGGIAPYAFSAGSGLPPDVTVQSDGSVSGTPSAPGTYSATVTIRDSAAPPQVRQATIQIDVAAALRIYTASLPPMGPNIPYSATIEATGGKAPYTWNTNPTGLPVGIGASVDGSGRLVLSGTTTESNTRDVTFSATDADGRPVTRTYALTLVPPSANRSMIEAASVAFGSTANGASGRYSILNNAYASGNVSAARALQIAKDQTPGTMVSGFLGQFFAGASGTAFTTTYTYQSEVLFNALNQDVSFPGGACPGKVTAFYTFRNASGDTVHTMSVLLPTQAGMTHAGGPAGAGYRITNALGVVAKTVTATYSMSGFTTSNCGGSSFNVMVGSGLAD